MVVKWAYDSFLTFFYNNKELHFTGGVGGAFGPHPPASSINNRQKVNCNLSVIIILLDNLLMIKVFFMIDDIPFCLY